MGNFLPKNEDEQATGNGLDDYTGKIILTNESYSSRDASERNAILAARTSIQLPPPPPPPAPPPPDFLDDMNPGNPQHFNQPAIHEDVEFGHNAVQLAVPDPHPAPPPPDLLE